MAHITALLDSTTANLLSSPPTTPAPGAVNGVSRVPRSPLGLTSTAHRTTGLDVLHSTHRFQPYPSDQTPRCSRIESPTENNSLSRSTHRTAGLGADHNTPRLRSYLEDHTPQGGPVDLPVTNNSSPRSSTNIIDHSPQRPARHHVRVKPGCTPLPVNHDERRSLNTVYETSPVLPPPISMQRARGTVAACIPPKAETTCCIATSPPQ